MRRNRIPALFGALASAVVFSATSAAAEPPLPDAKPVPDVQVLPLPTTRRPSSTWGGS